MEALTLWHDERSNLFFRSPDAGPDPYELPFTISNVSAADLAKAFEKVLAKAEPETIKPLNKPRKSLQDQMALVLRILTKEFVSLLDIMPEHYTRSDAVYWFLALLELMRLGQVQAQVNEDMVEFALA
jgi:chromatin segregation and condensation protein Rec8/ScpA/Scc1 (kleisin family)